MSLGVHSWFEQELSIAVLKNLYDGQKIVNSIIQRVKYAYMFKVIEPATNTDEEGTINQVYLNRRVKIVSQFYAENRSESGKIKKLIHGIGGKLRGRQLQFPRNEGTVRFFSQVGH